MQLLLPLLLFPVLLLTLLLFALLLLALLLLLLLLPLQLLLHLCFMLPLLLFRLHACSALLIWYNESAISCVSQACKIQHMENTVLQQSNRCSRTPSERQNFCGNLKRPELNPPLPAPSVSRVRGVSATAGEEPQQNATIQGSLQSACFLPPITKCMRIHQNSQCVTAARTRQYLFTCIFAPADCLSAPCGCVLLANPAGAAGAAHATVAGEVHLHLLAVPAVSTASVACTSPTSYSSGLLQLNCSQHVHGREGSTCLSDK